MHEHSGVMRISLKYGSDSRFTDYGSVGKAAEATSNGKFYLSLSDITNLIIGFMGYKSDTTFEINVRKIALWGPISPTNDAPTLSVDVSDITGGLIVTDKAAPNHRARMAISSPFSIWLKPNTDNIAVAILPGTGDLGVMDVSVSWRRFQL